MPFLRERDQTLGQKYKAGGRNRELVGLGSKQATLDPHEITEIEQLVGPEVPLRQRVLPDVDLNAGLPVRQHQEVGFAEAPYDQEPTRRRGVHLRLIKVLAAASPVGRDERFDRIGSPKGVRVGGDAEVDQLGQVRAALHELVSFSPVGHQQKSLTVNGQLSVVSQEVGAFLASWLNAESRSLSPQPSLLLGLRPASASRHPARR